MLPKSGKVLHVSREAYARTIAAALRNHIEARGGNIKTVMGWTGASERSVKNWLQGEIGPSGEHLVELAAHSEEVVLAFLLLARRRQAAIGIGVHALRLEMARLIAIMEDD